MTGPHPNDSALQFASLPKREEYDAVVVGSGPNGLSAAIELARAGRSVLVLEAKASIGGGTRTEELTLPGYLHDVCSAVHPMAVASPFFKSLPLVEFGLEWCYPVDPHASVAHPFENGAVAVAYQSLDGTVANLGEDGPRYRKLFEPFVQGAESLLAETLGPFHLPRHPVLMMRFGLRAVYSASVLANRWFRGEYAKGLFAGMAAHSVMPLERPLTSAVGLMLGITAHSVGWPVAKGGSREITNALAKYLLSLGGEIVVNSPIHHLNDLPRARAVLFDVTPPQIAAIAGSELPEKYCRKLNKYRFGPGVFKVDWALDGPIPWKAQECLLASTVHVGGTLAEVAEAERAAWENRIADRPFLLIAQQSLFDDTRAPAGKHPVWGYCHVPHGSTVDMTERMERQMERFAPGFRERILAKNVMTPKDYHTYNANYIGGDITGGVMDLGQLFTRPVSLWNPYSTPNPRLFICSSSTPPGGGVHGMCGYHAAKAALRSVLRD
jgi:phytoene dehydrogenase-like protein